MATPGFEIWKFANDHKKHNNFIFIVFMASFTVGTKIIKGFTNDLYKIYQVSVFSLVYIEF